LGGAIGESSNAFSWLGGGGSLGVRLDRFDDAPLRAGFIAGGWASVGHAIEREQSSACDADDNRPYVVLVLGIRGTELYASPKVGLMHIPSFCLKLFDDGESF
jgi:hypothetical protein